MIANLPRDEHDAIEDRLDREMAQVEADMRETGHRPRWIVWLIVGGALALSVAVPLFAATYHR